ncbi:MAG TPA: helix-turn-helix domain-containing protein [Dehalococcoidales bacterium]
MARIYGYYCPVAHALGVVGDRWSLLIVRDLLRKPKRFTDLLSYLSNITPKWLMLRLRELEEAGVVEREQRQDRREVWYKLTPAGQELRPVVEALWSWGLRYAMRPPLPGEVVHPESAVGTLTSSLNNRGRKLLQPRNWLFNFTTGGPYTLSYNGERWSAREGEVKNPDVTIVTSPEAWATFLAVNRDERRKLAQIMHIDGTPELIEEFLHTLGVRDEIAQLHSKH